MAATMTRAALLAAAEAARSRNPAWIATGGASGSADAAETTFVRPVQRGAVWIHEDGGNATLVMRDPRDVVEQIQRAANAVLRARGHATIREDATWGPRTRDAMRELVGALDGPRTVAGDAMPAAPLIESALLAAFHGGRGQVVLPRRVELPAFTTGQEVARMPAGHADALALAEGGRVLPWATMDDSARLAAWRSFAAALALAEGGRVLPPPPAPPVPPPPPPVPPAPAICNPRLVLAALPPGKTAEAWATMDDSARLAAWRSFAAANPGASIPGCPPGARVEDVVLPPSPAPPAAQANAWGTARAVVIAGGFAALGYVTYVVARELRSPSGRGPRRVTRRLSVPPRRVRS